MFSRPRTTRVASGPFGCSRRALLAQAPVARLPAAMLKGDAAVFVQRTSVGGAPDPDRVRESEPTHWLQCLHCNHNVTRVSAGLDVNGKHEHSFINPAGVIYRIGCFGHAPGVIEVGEASGHFTWFAGYVWRIALCARCERHLGWGFHSSEANFFGLVLAELKDAT